ncbi:MAG: HEAT repeat domain-containing protein [Acidobacteria bacterium]|nr:HEAT repeat domain-containing protein [Acidobacteriota bacterium]
MILKPLARRMLAFTMLVLLSSNLVWARPFKNPFFDVGDDVKKLPPVNWIRSRQIDVKHILIDLKFDWDKESAYGTTTITVAPFSDTDRITLDAAAMTINSVKLASGADLKFDYDGKKDNDNLGITLDRVYKSGEDVTVKIDYRTNYVNTASGDTAIGSFGRGLRFIKPTEDEPNKPRQIWSQGESEFNRYWFPSYDTPNDFRTTELRATVGKQYFVVSNGQLVDTKDNGDGTRTFDWKMDIPYSNYLTSIVVGEYAEVKNGEYDGKPVVAYGYPSETKEVAATTKNLPATIKFFSDKTGVKYAYPKYSQTFVEDFGGGMENISATTQIEEMIHDDRELLDTDSESLQSHELAHQWFGDYVTCRDWGQIWLNESFATYFQALWDEEFKGHDYFLYGDVRSNQQQTIGTWNQGNRRPIVTKYYANKDAMFDTYAYPGGGSVLHMLRKHLGDERFFKALNHYLTVNAHQPVSTEDLRIAIEETTGESMDWFFDQWLYKMGHPIFEVTQKYDEGSKKLTLDVKQTQKTDPLNEYPQTEYFQAKVDVEIDGRVEQVWLKPQADNVFTFDAPTKPKLVNFDYQSTLLKELKFDKSTDELVYQLANDKDILGRRWALTELSERMKDQSDRAKILDAVRSTAEKDASWLIRRDAIETLTEVYVPQLPPGMAAPPAKIDEATTQMLMKAVKDEQSLIRAAALTLLGATHDQKYADLYLASLEDRSYGVIDAAAVALGDTKSPKALDALTRLTTGTSWRGRIETAGLNGLAALGDKKAFETSYKFATDKTKDYNARIAALKVVGETGKGDERAYPLIFKQFKTALDQTDYNGLFTSVVAVIKLADPRGQEVFNMLREKFKGQDNIAGAINYFEGQFKAAIKK